MDLVVPIGTLRAQRVKQCKEEMNSLRHVERTLSVAPEAQLDFVTELESVVKNQVIILKR